MVSYHRSTLRHPDALLLPLELKERKMHVVGTPVASVNGSKKFRIELTDGRQIESVFLHERNAFGICLSVQVGCNMGCVFCATAQQPSERNLTTDEIVRQVALLLETERSPLPFEYVTLAGMGEPLANYTHSVQALERLRDEFGLKEVSLSTVGLRHGLRKLVKERRTFRLYLSLHATTDSIRQQLIPIARQCPIAELVDLISEYGGVNEFGKARVSYLLLKGVNDSDEDLQRLIQLLQGRPVMVQVLLWNEIPGPAFIRVTDFEATKWARQLQSAGIDAYAMPSFGRSVGAGCGQLITRPHTDERRAGVRLVGEIS